MAATPPNSVQCFGRKKTAGAVTHCKAGRGLIDQRRSNRARTAGDPPLQGVRADSSRRPSQVFRRRYEDPSERRRSHSQIYAIRQSISKALVAYFQKFVDEEQKKEIKDVLVRYDRTLLVADPRRCEPKKFGGRGARARFQKWYR